MDIFTKASDSFDKENKITDISCGDLMTMLKANSSSSLGGSSASLPTFVDVDALNNNSLAGYFLEGAKPKKGKRCDASTQFEDPLAIKPSEQNLFLRGLLSSEVFGGESVLSSGMFKENPNDVLRDILNLDRLDLRTRYERDYILKIGIESDIARQMPLGLASKFQEFPDLRRTTQAEPIRDNLVIGQDGEVVKIRNGATAIKQNGHKKKSRLNPNSKPFQPRNYKVNNGIQTTTAAREQKRAVVVEKKAAAPKQQPKDSLSHLFDKAAISERYERELEQVMTSPTTGNHVSFVDDSFFGAFAKSKTFNSGTQDKIFGALPTKAAPQAFTFDPVLGQRVLRARPTEAIPMQF